MPNRPYLIDAFRDLRGTVEVIGMGGVRQPTGSAQEAEVSVLVSSGAGLPGDGMRTQFVHIGCGQLDMLTAGSRWIKGRPNGHAPSQKIAGSFEFVGMEAIGEGKTSAFKNNNPFPSRPIATASGFLLKRTSQDATAPASGYRRSQPDWIFLPTMELLRALFGVSSSLLLELFDGIRNPAVSGERGLIDRKLSTLSDDGTVKLVVGRNLTRHEALIGAALLADPKVRRLHDSVFQQLSASRDWKQGLPVYLNLEWPWTDPVPLEFEGRWIERVNGRLRFIITRILSFGMPLPFNRIEVHHPGAESDEDDGLPPPEGRLRSANVRLMVVTTGRAATPSRRPVEIGTKIVELSNASSIEILSVPQGGQARQDRAGIGEKPRDEAPVGTGGRQSGADIEVGHAVLKRKRGEANSPSVRSMDKALDATWQAINLCCTEQRWKLEALPEMGKASSTELHGGLDLAREPLVARITIGSDIVLVVDRGSPNGDECSLGILVPKVAFKSDRNLGSALRTACRSVNGRWRSRRLDEPQFKVTSINRASNVWDDRRAYAELLARRIAAALVS